MSDRFDGESCKCVRITINMGNDGMSSRSDFVSMLRTLADLLEEGKNPFYIMDYNGNGVGDVDYL